MYGEGYDWTSLYSVRSGQMVGAIPVGIETKGTADAPYWPNQAGWTYKEVWTQPAGEWIWLMQDLSGPAVVEGIVDPDIQVVNLIDQKTGAVINATLNEPKGRFRAVIPQGRYTVQAGKAHTSLTVLSAGAYQLDLRQSKAVDFTVKSKTISSTEILLQLSCEGSGTHTFTVKVDNLYLIGPSIMQVALGQHNTHEMAWRARIIDNSSPWVAVILPDGSINQHRELTGLAAAK
jgi:hypothetical protein